MIDEQPRSNRRGVNADRRSFRLTADCVLVEPACEGLPKPKKPGNNPLMFGNACASPTELRMSFLQSIKLSSGFAHSAGVSRTARPVIFHRAVTLESATLS